MAQTMSGYWVQAISSPENTVLSSKWEAMAVFLLTLYGECGALCESEGRINTASLRIPSIQDNLIPAERAPPLWALALNDKEKNTLQKGA